MKDYFDYRDVPFKVIKTFLRLSKKSRDKLTALVLQWDTGKNNFKKIIDLIADIEQADPELDFWTGMAEFSVFDSFYAGLYRLRYPSYHEMVERKNSLLQKLKQRDLKILVPEYFEGNEITVAVKVRKNEAKRDMVSKIDRIDDKLLAGLLELL